MKRRLVGCLLLASACAGPSPELSSHAEGILRGTEDARTTAVLMAGHMVGDGMFCSATLIAPDLVLTARHCIGATTAGAATLTCEGSDASRFATVHPASAVTVLAGPAVDDLSAVALPVAEVLELPGGGDVPNCGNDVVMLRLRRVYTAAAPAEVRLSAPVSVGETLSVVGYGYATPGDDTSFGTRRRRDDARVVHVGRVEMGTPARAVLVDGEFGVDEGPCPGDSGGPAFDAQGRVVGVMSRGNTLTCQGMVYESVQPHAEWIRAAVLASYARRGEAAPAWAQSEPGDAGAGDAGAGDAGAGDAGAGSMGAGGGCAVRASSGGGGAGGACWAAGAAAIAVMGRRRKRAKRGGRTI